VHAYRDYLFDDVRRFSAGKTLRRLGNATLQGVVPFS
jgi:hypothetical protein